MFMHNIHHHFLTCTLCGKDLQECLADPTCNDGVWSEEAVQLLKGLIVPKLTEAEQQKIQYFYDIPESAFPIAGGLEEWKRWKEQVDFLRSNTDAAGI